MGGARVSENKRLDAKCAACGHVWTVVYLPVPVDLLNKFTRVPCPKCHAPKPLMAGKDDLTEEDRLRELVRVSYHALTPDRPTGPLADQLLARLRQRLEAVVKAHFPGEIGPLGQRGEAENG
jgi:hypothetical protein